MQIQNVAKIILFFNFLLKNYEPNLQANHLQPLKQNDYNTIS